MLGCLLMLNLLQMHHHYPQLYSHSHRLTACIHTYIHTYIHSRFGAGSLVNEGRVVERVYNMHQEFLICRKIYLSIEQYIGTTSWVTLRSWGQALHIHCRVTYQPRYILGPRRVYIYNYIYDHSKTKPDKSITSCHVTGVFASNVCIDFDLITTESSLGTRSSLVYAGWTQMLASTDVSQTVS